MEITIRKAEPQDYEKMIAFGNMVFGIDFPALLPKLYVGRPALSPFHYLLTEGEEIKAMIGCFPFRLHVGERVLDCRCIGTVSVHPDARGKGYMKLLMARADADARAEGADMVWLSGRRQRYEYFGFAKVAPVIVFSLTPTNRRHLQAVSTEGIELVPLTEKSPLLDECVRLHDSQKLYVERAAADFTDILRSWNSECWAILERGVFLGYASVSKERDKVQELVLKEEADPLQAALRIVEFCNQEVRFHPSSAQQKLIASLDSAAESMEIAQEISVNLLNYPRVLEAYMNLQKPLADGSLVIGVPGRGRYEILVERGEARVNETEKPADLTLPGLEMMRRLFAPAGFVRDGEVLERSWFPIPLTIPEADMD